MTKKNIITCIMLTALFIATAAICLTIDLSKNINIADYFSNQIIIAQGNDENTITLDKLTSKSSGDISDIKKITLTCTKDIDIDKILFNILASTEDVINLKISINNKYLNNSPAILTKNGTKKIILEQELSLKSGDTYTIEFDCNIDFDIYNMSARK